MTTNTILRIKTRYGWVTRINLLCKRFDSLYHRRGLRSQWSYKQITTSSSHTVSMGIHQKLLHEIQTKVWVLSCLIHLKPVRIVQNCKKLRLSKLAIERSKMKAEMLFIDFITLSTVSMGGKMHCLLYLITVLIRLGIIIWKRSQN